MERARTELLRLLGIDPGGAIKDGEGGYAGTALAIRYLRPARLDDKLVGVSKVTQIRAASGNIHQRVMRGDTILTEADVTVALVGPTGRPRRQLFVWFVVFVLVLVLGVVC